MSEFEIKLNQAIERHQAGQTEQALTMYQALLRAKSDHPYLLFLHGVALFQMGKQKEAIRAFQQSVQIAPNPVTYDNLGVAHAALKQYAQSLSCFNESIRLNPNSPNTLANLGGTLKEVGRFDEAVESCSTAIRLEPNFYPAYLNRANAKYGMKLFDDAIKDYRKSLQLSPASLDALIGISGAYYEIGKMAESLDYANKAIQLDPTNAMPFYRKGKALLRLGDTAGALACYQKCLTLKPKIDFLLGTIAVLKMRLCDWRNHDHDITTLKNSVLQNLAAARPFSLLPILDSAQAQQICANNFIKRIYPGREINDLFKARPRDQKIKLGYFSADFHNHATMHLIAEVLERHDKKKFEVYGFSFGPVTNDEWQTRAKNSFDHFINCRDISDAQIAQLSRSHEIDIAIDLKGFTQDSRTGIFSERAAPIQINYLGYPGTMGADFIDYIIADHMVIPEDHRAFFTEKVAYLPECYQPNNHSRQTAQKQFFRSDVGLPERGFVFCSFNANYKITPHIFSSWVNILMAVDESILWILVNDSVAKNNLKQQAMLCGIDVDRLVFAEHIPIEEHFNRIRLADVMLDTFPCGAHTTASDSLRMGLPVVTMIGETFASRVASSLLNAAGLEELVTDSTKAYENLAIKLATSPIYLQKIREKMSAIASSPLYDSESYTRELERLYKTMHEMHCTNTPLDHIL